MKYLLISLALAYVGENESVRPGLLALEQTGKLVTIRLQGSGPLKIFVVGKEQAELDPKTFKLTVRSPGQPNELRLSQVDNYYTILDPIKRPSDLEITAKVKEKSETFKFQLPKDLP